MMLGEKSEHHVLLKKAKQIKRIHTVRIFLTTNIVKVYYYQGTLTSTTTEVRGTATGNIFLSNSPSAYPANGVKDGYWYYRTQVGYTG